MDEENSYGNLLKSFRVRKGTRRGTQWTQQQMADKLEISRGTYNSWENGKIPPARYRKKIIELLDLNKEQEDALNRAAAEAPPETPEIDNLPFRNPFFTGRKVPLQQLAHQLKENGSVAINQPVSVSGLGGIGKTQLALEYAHSHHPKPYRAVLWVKNAVNEQALQVGYDDLAHLLELPERDERDPKRRVQAVKQWLKTYTDWLLILDNADDLEVAVSLLPAKPKGHILLTTRSQIRGTVTTAWIEIEEMEPDDGVLFLLKRAGMVQDETGLATIASDVREAARTVADLLGGLPLALDQAGAFIEETRVSLAEYIQRYQNERPYLLNRRGLSKSHHPDSVTVTFALSLRNASMHHPLAADILHFCAFLQPDAIPEEVFQYDKDLSFGTIAFNEAVAALNRYSLIKHNNQDKTFSMHRLVQAVLVDSIPPELKKQWQERVARALNAAFPGVKFQEWKQCGRLLPHVLICATWTEYELTTIPEVSELFHKAGIYLDERAQYAEAEALLVRAISIREQCLGSEHPDTAQSLNDLAWLYDHRARYAEAEPLHQRALVIREKQLGPEHPDTAESLNNLGVLHRHWGKHEEAEPFHRRALVIREKQLGPEHIDTAESLNNLGLLYSELGKYAEAEPLLKRALAIREKRLGVEHPDTAQSLNNLAFLYDFQERFIEAEPLHQRGLAIREKHLGPEHPDTAQSLNNLAWLYAHQGKYEEAETLYQRGLAIDTKTYGPEHPNVAFDLNVLADFYHRQGKYEQAEQPYLRALAIREQQLGPTHPDTQWTRKAYAALLRIVGRDAEAAEIEASQMQDTN